MSANIEDKKIVFNVNAKGLRPFSSSLQDTNVVALSPFPSFLAINQGDGESDRVGNKIKLKHLSINFDLYPMPYNASTNPIIQPQNIMFLVFYDKSNPTTLPTPTANGDFFDFNNSAQNFQGNLTDLSRWFNTDRYKIFYKRIFKLGFASYESAGPDTNNELFSNNDYKLSFVNIHVPLTKYAVSRVQFDDNDATPTTRGLFAMWISVPASNAGWPSGTVSASVTYQVHAEYEDA